MRRGPTRGRTRQARSARRTPRATRVTARSMPTAPKTQPTPQSLACFTGVPGVSGDGRAIKNAEATNA